MRLEGTAWGGHTRESRAEQASVPAGGCGARGWGGSKDKPILLALHRSPPLIMTPSSHDGHCVMAAFWFSCRVLLWPALTQSHMGRGSRKCGSGSAKSAQEVSSTLDPWQSFLFLFPQVAA